MENHDTLADDTLFELLASPRRRLLLSALSEHSGSRRLKALSRDIVAHEDGEEPDDIDEDDVMRVYVALYQTHIPELNAHGLVEYDDDERVVHMSDRGAHAVAFLRNPPTQRRHWAVYYGTVAAVLGGVVAARVFLPISIPELFVATFTLASVTALLGLAAVHYYRSHALGFCNIGLERRVP